MANPIVKLYATLMNVAPVVKFGLLRAQIPAIWAPAPVYRSGNTLRSCSALSVPTQQPFSSILCKRL